MPGGGFGFNKYQIYLSLSKEHKNVFKKKKTVRVHKNHWDGETQIVPEAKQHKVLFRCKKKKKRFQTLGSRP